jgi:hypothetical protein
MKKPVMHAPHGAKPLRGLQTTSQSTISGVAKFGRMFRWLPPAQQATTAREMLDLEELMQALAKEMITNEFTDNLKGNVFPKEDPTLENTPDAPISIAEEDDENPTIPAGYTYFGQFVDHDLTFDPASFLQQLNDPNALVDFRTPRFDLDCVYGRGPADQPYLYKGPERVHFALGKPIGNAGDNKVDLPRVDHGEGDRFALIGDKRNDENKIVSQIQSLFLQFHNKVFDKVVAGFPNLDKDSAFGEAQRIVRWTYQWIVLNDYLKRICDPEIYGTMQPDVKVHKGPKLNFYHSHDDGFIPVEFAAAAYRFGHSMVRPSYKLNDIAISTATFKLGGTPFDFARIPVFQPQSSPNTLAMNGFGQEMPQDWGIKWNFFFGVHKKGDKRKIPQPSYRIDSKLVDPLAMLPEFASQFPNEEPHTLKTRIASLAFRNLIRGVSMGLPSGESIAAMMGLETKDIVSPDELWKFRFKATQKTKREKWDEGEALFNNPKNQKWLEGSTPLWFYILKEAEMKADGERLGKVGSTIVAETFYGLMWADHYSYLFQQPKWKPSDEKIGLSADPDMLELTTFVNS